MGLNRYSKRKDSTQGDIVKALRKAGVTVYIQDTPVDLLLNYMGLWSVMECKSKGGKLTPNQKKFLEKHPETPIVETPEEALRAVGAI